MNARAWDDAQGEQGNTFQRELVFPAAEQLLDVPAVHYQKAGVSLSVLTDASPAHYRMRRLLWAVPGPRDWLWEWFVCKAACKMWSC